MTVVLVSGIDGRLAGLVAGVLAAQPRIHVIGVGRATPPQALPSVAIQVCDMRGDTLRELMQATPVDVAIHLDMVGEEEPDARDRSGRGNVYRAIELLGACRAAGVARVILRSSMLVYGARSDAPAFIDERAPLSSGAPAGLLQDYIELERVADDFRSRHAEMRLTLLRCAGLVGGGVSSPLARYLTLRSAPLLAGFDPRIQVLHTYDAAVAFALAALSDRVDGAFNIAAGPPVLLSQAICLAGGSVLPLPALAYAIAPWIKAEALVSAPPFTLDYLRYACVGDTARARRDLQWEAQHQPEETLRELAGV